jgi:hypothetical protein
MCEKCFDFSFAYLLGMVLIVKEDVAANPLHVGFFSAV